MLSWHLGTIIGENVRGIFCEEGKFVRWDVQWEIVQSEKSLGECWQEGDVQMSMQITQVCTWGGYDLGPPWLTDRHIHTALTAYTTSSASWTKKLRKTKTTVVTALFNCHGDLVPLSKLSSSFNFGGEKLRRVFNRGKVIDCDKGESCNECTK